MHFFRTALGVWLLLWLMGNGQAGHRDDLSAINSKLKGKLLDFTSRHGFDNRIWSPALGHKRDLYMYLPPGYDPAVSYAFGIYLHGAGQDEDAFVQDIVEHYDEAIAQGKLPPLIIAAPDGSLKGRPSLLRSASFWVNSPAGRFEDWVQQDVWGFVNHNFRIRPERQAHALIGASMGGCGAFGHGIKYKDRYKIIVGVMPAVNLRWVDAAGNYETKFDPHNWGWRSSVNPLEVVGRGFGPFFRVRAGEMFRPVVGYGDHVIELLSSYNPIEMIDRHHLKDGELSMYIAYGGLDEFNIDAQVKSFLYLAQSRGIHVASDYDPLGHHNTASGLKLLPNILKWMAPQVPPPVRLGK